MAKYSPETRKQKAERLKNMAKTKNNKERTGEKPCTLKFGLNHVTYLIEQKKAKLVVIANDVAPIETVVFLPTLCKAMDIPYCIVQNKAKLGKLVHKKSAAVVALTDFKANQSDLNTITRVCKEQFNSVKQVHKNPEKGIKSEARERELAKIKLLEEAKKGTV